LVGRFPWPDQRVADWSSFYSKNTVVATIDVVVLVISVLLIVSLNTVIGGIFLVSSHNFTIIDHHLFFFP